MVVAAPLRAAEPAPAKIVVPEETLDQPPAAVVDEDVPAELFDAEVPPWVAPAAPVSELSYVAELTQADKIETACARLHPQVRHFVEEELRGRFVAVQKQLATAEAVGK